jgi:hypothetical protein
MLSVDPKKRLTIEEVMKNNWVAQYTNVRITIKLYFDSEIDQQFHFRFLKRRFTQIEF